MRDVWVLCSMTDCEGGFPIGVYSALGIAQVFAESDAHELGQKLGLWREGPAGTWSADVQDRAIFYEIRFFRVDDMGEDA